MEMDSYIKNKIYLFVGVFCFHFSILMIEQLSKKCAIDITQILKAAVARALYVVLGYSIYTDLMNMEDTRKYIISHTTEKTIGVFACVCIILFLAVVKSIELMFNSNDKLCISK